MLVVAACLQRVAYYEWSPVHRSDPRLNPQSYHVSAFSERDGSTTQLCSLKADGDTRWSLMRSVCQSKLLTHLTVTCPPGVLIDITTSEYNEHTGLLRSSWLSVYRVVP